MWYYDCIARLLLLDTGEVCPGRPPIPCLLCTGDAVDPMLPMKASGFMPIHGDLPDCTSEASTGAMCIW